VSGPRGSTKATRSPARTPMLRRVQARRFDRRSSSSYVQSAPGPTSACFFGAFTAQYPTGVVTNGPGNAEGSVAVSGVCMRFVSGGDAFSKAIKHRNRRTQALTLQIPLNLQR